MVIGAQPVDLSAGFRLTGFSAGPDPTPPTLAAWREARPYCPT